MKLKQMLTRICDPKLQNEDWGLDRILRQNPDLVYITQNRECQFLLYDAKPLSDGDGNWSAPEAVFDHPRRAGGFAQAQDWRTAIAEVKDILPQLPDENDVENW